MSKPVFELQEGFEAIVQRAQKEMRKSNISEDVIKEFTYQAMSVILNDDAFGDLQKVLERYFDVNKED